MYGYDKDIYIEKGKERKIYNLLVFYNKLKNSIQYADKKVTFAVAEKEYKSLHENCSKYDENDAATKTAKNVFGDILKQFERYVSELCLVLGKKSKFVSQKQFQTEKYKLGKIKLSEFKAKLKSDQFHSGKKQCPLIDWIQAKIELAMEEISQKLDELEEPVDKDKSDLNKSVKKIKDILRAEELHGAMYDDGIYIEGENRFSPQINDTTNDKRYSGYLFSDDGINDIGLGLNREAYPIGNSGNTSNKYNEKLMTRKKANDKSFE